MVWVNELFYGILLLISFIFYTIGVVKISKFVHQTASSQEVALNLQSLKLHIAFTVIFFFGKILAFTSQILFYESQKTSYTYLRLSSLIANNFTNAGG
jgi:hypothetical protein